MTHSISTGETVRTLFLRREGPTPDGPQPLPVTFSGPLTGYHLCWHPSGSGTTVITNERGLSVGQMVHSGEQSLASLVLAVNSEVTQCLLWEDPDGAEMRAVLGLSKEQAASFAQFVQVNEVE